MRKAGFPEMAVLASSLWMGSVWAADPAMPFQSQWQHVGVATCAGSNCHGSQRPFDDSPVLQNEYFLWQNKDAHSNAYKLLLTPESKRIAANLGIKNAAAAEECLVCHTDHVAAAQRGRRYAIEEGVGCEACHGGAKDWLGPHVSGNTHAQNVASGLYPLEDPLARTRLCLQCHMGTAAKPIDHRMMGAGHPPLEFEPAFFTQIQPAHFRVDKDYRERKPAHQPGAKLWAIGQLLSSETFLDGLLGTRFTDRGLFPELVFFDCNACHHPMRPPRWAPGVGGPLGPGEVRLADASLAISGMILKTLAPESAGSWNAALNDLHKASTQSVNQTREVAGRLKQIAQTAVTNLNRRAIDKKEALNLIDALAQWGLDGRAGDFTAGKQIFYGVDALILFLKEQHGLPKDAMQAEADALFGAIDVRQGGVYNPAAMQAALRNLRAAVEKAR